MMLPIIQSIHVARSQSPNNPQEFLWLREEIVVLGEGMGWRRTRDGIREDKRREECDECTRGFGIWDEVKRRGSGGILEREKA